MIIVLKHGMSGNYLLHRGLGHVGRQIPAFYWAFDFWSSEFFDSDHNSPQYQTSYGQQNDENRNKNSSNNCYYLLYSFQFITVHHRSTVVLAVIVIALVIAITTIIPTTIIPLRIIARDASWWVLLIVLGMCQEGRELPEGRLYMFSLGNIIVNGE